MATAAGASTDAVVNQNAGCLAADRPTDMWALPLGLPPKEHENLDWARLPPAINGLALGSICLAGVWIRMGQLFAFDSSYIALPLCAFSGFLILVYLGKATISPIGISEDVAVAPALAVVSTGPICLTALGTLIFVVYGHAQGVQLAVVGTLLQVFCAIIFLGQCLVKGLKPEPYWFPPTVGLAVAAVAGVKCGYPGWEAHALFGVGVFFMLILTPLVTFRVARYTQFVAPGPSVAILAAPAPIIALAFDEVFSEMEPWKDLTFISNVSWTITFVLFAVTFFALILRRATWLNLPFLPSWAAFAFPLPIVTEVVITGYVWSHENGTWFWISWVSVGVCSVVLMFVCGEFLAQMRQWMRGSLQRKIPVAMQRRLTGSHRGSANYVDMASFQAELQAETAAFEEEAQTGTRSRTRTSQGPGSAVLPPPGWGGSSQETLITGARDVEEGGGIDQWATAPPPGVAGTKSLDSQSTTKTKQTLIELASRLSVLPGLDSQELLGDVGAGAVVSKGNTMRSEVIDEEAEAKALEELMAAELALDDEDEVETKAQAEAMAKARKEAKDKLDAEEKERKEAEEAAANSKALGEEISRKESQAVAESDEIFKRSAVLDGKARKQAGGAEAKTTAEANAKAEAEAKAKKDAEEKAKKDAEEKAKKEAEEKATKDPEEKAKKDAEEKAKIEEIRKLSEEEKAKAFAKTVAVEAVSKSDKREKARKVAETSAAKAKAELDAKLRKAEARAKKIEAEAEAKADAEEMAKKDAAEAEATAKAEAEAKVRMEAEAKAKAEAEEKARKDAEEAAAKAKAEAEEQARKEAEAAEAKAKAEAEEKAQSEAAEAEAKAKAAAEEQARKEAEEAEAKTKAEADEKARKEEEEAEPKAKAEAEEKARKQAEEAEAITKVEAERAQREAEEAEAKAKEEAEEKARVTAQEAAARARAEAEEKALAEAMAAAAAKAKAEAEEKASKQLEEPEGHHSKGKKKSGKSHRYKSRKASDVSDVSEVSEVDEEHTQQGAEEAEAKANAEGDDHSGKEAEDTGAKGKRGKKKSRHRNKSRKASDVSDVSEVSEVSGEDAEAKGKK